MKAVLTLYNVFFTFELIEIIYLSLFGTHYPIMKFDFMKPWLPLIVLAFSLFSANIQAQDFHWTLFEYGSLNVNPAQTGAFYGSYRISGIVRDSEFGSNVTTGITNVYGPSYTISVDAPIIQGFRKKDWVGIGATFYSDGAGDGTLSRNRSHLSVAYHLGLNKKQTNVLTFGLQGGMGTRKFKDYQDLRFADGTADQTSGATLTGERFDFGNPSPNTNDPSRTNLENGGGFDLNFGVLYKTKPNKTTAVEVGAAINHIWPFRHGFKIDPSSVNPLDSTDRLAYKLPLNVMLHYGMDYQFRRNKKMSIRPTAQLRLVSGAKPYFQLAAMMGYKLDPKKDLILKFGPGYRVGDAAQVLLGVEKGPIRAAMSYDINLSNLSQINTFGGGAEIAVSYIGTIFKQPDLKPVLLCPRY